jgi:hypothetical protein
MLGRAIHAGARFWLALVIALVIGLAGIVAASAAPASTAEEDKVAEHAGEIFTEEQNCFETIDRRPVPIELVRSYVPAAYIPAAFTSPGPPVWPVAGQAVGSVGFTDYVCESFSVNGHQPRPTIISMGVVVLDPAHAGVPPRRLYVLWVGTDNPLLFARLQQLGVNVYFIPRSSYTQVATTAPDGTPRTEIIVNYVGNGPGGLDYTRTITATEGVAPTPADGPASGWYHLGSKGEVALSFMNDFASAGTARVCLDYGLDSLPTQYGLTEFTDGTCFPTLRLFLRGSWEGHWELLN